MLDHVELTIEGAVATVALNRPEAMNALNDQMKVDLLAVLRTVAEDASVRAVVLTGNGRAFCVGQDLNELSAGLAEDANGFWDTVRDHYSPIVRLIATMPKPVVVALNGVAAGAGAAFALAGDVRIASVQAGMNTAFVSIGLSADSGSTWWLPRLVGVAKAKSLLMRPRSLSADQCLAEGLVEEVVVHELLGERAGSLAAELAQGPTRAYAALRLAVVESASSSLSEALALEEGLMRDTGTTNDHREAVAAFLGKGSPEFTGS